MDLRVQIIQYQRQNRGIYSQERIKSKAIFVKTGRINNAQLLNYNKLQMCKREFQLMNKVNKDEKIIVYGAGKRCIGLYKILASLNVTILMIVDSDKNKLGVKIGSFLVESPEKIRDFQDAKICITVADNSVFTEISEILHIKYGCSKDRIISYYRFIIEAYCNCTLINEYILTCKAQQQPRTSVLFDSICGLGLGGVEAWTIEMCQTLNKYCDDNAYIVTDGEDYCIPNVLKEHVLSANINHEERFSIDTIKSLIQIIIEKMPCKVITSTTNEMLLAAYLIKQIYSDMIEIISVIHNSNDTVYAAYMDFKECPDIFIGVSQDIKRNMLQRGINRDRLYSMTCPFVCEETLYRTYTENRAYPIRIGYAGRMDGMEHSQKRMDLLLKLVMLLVERKINFMMELAGDGPVRIEMESYIKNNHLDKYVKFLGYLHRDKIPDFWKRQDICINLADYEGRSISIIEAMGNGGVPVVTATSGVTEDIIESVNGYIVPVGDYVLAADRIDVLERHRNRLAEMGKKAHDMVYPKSLMNSHLEFWKHILYGT